MSGLNDDVEEGLEPEGDVLQVSDEVEIVSTQNPLQPEPQVVTLISSDSVDKKEFLEPSYSDLFGIGVIPGEVPNFKGEFEVIQQRRDNLNDFIETTNGVISKRSISQEDVRNLDACIPGFVNDGRPIEYFTKENSQTFFNETASAMEKIISFEKSKISEDLKNHLDNLIYHHNSLITVFKSSFLENSINCCKLIKNLLENDIIFNDDKFQKYFSDSISFTNFTNTPINEIDASKVSCLKNIVELLDEIKNLYNDINLKSYLISFRFNSKGSLVFINQRSEDLNKGFTIAEVLDTHRNESQIELPTKIFIQLSSNESELNKLRNKAIIFTRRKNDNTDQDLLLTESTIVSLTQEYNYLCNLSYKMSEFNVAILKFISLFK